MNNENPTNGIIDPVQSSKDTNNPRVDTVVNYVKLWPGFERYFDLVDQNSTHFFVKCLLCNSSSKNLSTPKKSSFNIKNHVEVSLRLGQPM